MAFVMNCNSVSCTGTNPNNIWSGKGNSADIVFSIKDLSTNPSLALIAERHFISAVSSKSPSLPSFTTDSIGNPSAIRVGAADKSSGHSVA